MSKQSACPFVHRPFSLLPNNDSRKVWQNVAWCIQNKHQEKANEFKTYVEDVQRRERAFRDQRDIKWTPRMFRCYPNTTESKKDLDPWEFLNPLSKRRRDRNNQNMHQQEGARAPALAGEAITASSNHASNRSDDDQEEADDNDSFCGWSRNGEADELAGEERGGEEALEETKAGENINFSNAEQSENVDVDLESAAADLASAAADLASAAADLESAAAATVDDTRDARGGGGGFEAEPIAVESESGRNGSSITIRALEDGHSSGHNSQDLEPQETLV